MGKESFVIQINHKTREKKVIPLSHLKPEEIKKVIESLSNYKNEPQRKKA